MARARSVHTSGKRIVIDNRLLLVTIAVGLVAIVMSGYAILNPSTVIVYRNITPPTPPPSSCGQLPMQCFTHEQILARLQNPASNFAWSEYAAADFYVALTCKSLNNTAPVCSLPAIVKMEAGIAANSTAAKNVSGYNINGSLIQPSLSLSDAPVITANQVFGKRLTNINKPFNATELSIINNAPNSFYEKAGEMYMNHTLNVTVGAATPKLSMFVVNGKPSVIYLGSTTCIFCGENRWAMLLALSRFGNYSQIFKGYSAIQDGDLPTIYWAPSHYNGSATVFGSFYSSKYINFIMIEDNNPISGGFKLNPLTTILQRANQTGNTVFTSAMKYVIGTNAFSGTPFTVWGAYEVGGADAVVLGS